MKKYDNYEQAEAFTGEFETLEPGAYICKILKVEVEEKPYGDLMRIFFDIAEGERKDFYKKLYDKLGKWLGQYTQTVHKEYIQYFKGFMTALENSNSGFKWDWDENKLKGKLFGGVFGEEEYEKDGKIKVAVKCVQVRSIDKVREGKVEIPPLKKLNPSDAPFTPIDEANDDDLPF